MTDPTQTEERLYQFHTDRSLQRVAEQTQKRLAYWTDHQAQVEREIKIREEENQGSFYLVRQDTVLSYMKYFSVGTSEDAMSAFTCFLSGDSCSPLPLSDLLSGDGVEVDTAETFYILRDLGGMWWASGDGERFRAVGKCFDGRFDGHGDCGFTAEGVAERWGIADDDDNIAANEGFDAFDALLLSVILKALGQDPK